MAYTCTDAGWADLPLDLLDGIIARLPFPGDRVHLAAVCRAWRSAARQLVNNDLPWIVLPNGGICTAGRSAACSSFRIPGFPDEDTTTCLGAAHDWWLALDRTDDVLRRTPSGEQVVYARPDVKHRHAYMLHNPFSNVTVPLPELDAVIGHVAETFQVRRVLMRSPAPDDVVAVTTNNWNYNVILCRPGKGCFVLDEFRVVDIVFFGDTLYGITSGEELVAFHLGEDEDGRPNVTRIELVIKNPLAKYYYKYAWLWPQEVVDTREEGVGQADDHINGVSREEVLSGSNEDEDPSDDDGGDDEGDEDGPNEANDDNNAEEENHEEEEEDLNENPDDDELAEQALEDIFNNNGDEMISDNEEFDGYADGEVFDRFAQEYDAKDELYMGRYLVRSRSGELLLVRHQWQSCPSSQPYTLKIEVFKADFSARHKWVAVSVSDAKGEAIFLSRQYSKCSRAHGGIQGGFVYHATYLDDVFDTASCTTRNVTLGWPWQCRSKESTWLFPPELVV